MTAQTWPEFITNLANELSQMRALDTRIYSTGNRYVQVQALPDHITLQAVSNSFLAGADTLTSEEEQHLRDLGWHAPKADQPNWYHDVARPLDTDQATRAAQLLTNTILFVLHAAEPADLRIDAFNAQ